MLYVRIRSVGIGTVGPLGGKSDWGHAWVEISPIPGIPADRSQLESYGFYPESGDPPTNIRHSDARDYEGVGYTSDWFPVSEADAARARDYIQEAEGQRYYWLIPAVVIPIPDENCASFATNFMSRAGISTAIPVASVLPWFATGWRYRVNGPGDEYIDIDPRTNTGFMDATVPTPRDPLARTLTPPRT